MPTGSYLVADGESDPVAVSGKWRVVLPTDAPPAVLADFPSGTLPTGTFSIAANASPRQAAFSVTTVPNTTVTGDRYFDVEQYDVTPPEAQLVVAKVRTKIVEDDEASGGNLVQHGTTAKVPVRDVGVQQGQYVAWDLPATGRIDVPQFAYLSAKDANNSPMLGVVLNSGGDRGWVLKRLIDGTVNDFLTGAWPDTTALPNASTYRIEVSRYAGNGWDIKVNGVAVVGGGSNFNDLWSTAIQGNLIGFEGSEATATNVVTGTK